MEAVEEDSEVAEAASAEIVEVDAAADSVGTEEAGAVDLEVRGAVAATRTRRADRATGRASVATPTSASDRSAIGVEPASPEVEEEEEAVRCEVAEAVEEEETVTLLIRR